MKLTDRQPSVAQMEGTPKRRSYTGPNLEEARMVADLRTPGGIRRGTDILKALALGADVLLAGRAPLYGLRAGGAKRVVKALQIVGTEALDETGQMGVATRAGLNRDRLVPLSQLAGAGNRRSIAGAASRRATTDNAA
jgi:hypothetical protein